MGEAKLSVTPMPYRPCRTLALCEGGSGFGTEESADRGLETGRLNFFYTKVAKGAKAPKMIAIRFRLFVSFAALV